MVHFRAPVHIKQTTTLRQRVTHTTALGHTSGHGPLPAQSLSFLPLSLSTILPVPGRASPPPGPFFVNSNQAELFLLGNPMLSSHPNQIKLHFCNDALFCSLKHSPHSVLSTMKAFILLLSPYRSFDYQNNLYNTVSCDIGHKHRIFNLKRGIC